VAQRAKDQRGNVSGLPLPSLATVLSALDRASGLSETRVRDLRSAVRRTAELLGNAPAAIPLAMDKIQAALSAVNPIALGMTLKRFTNLRSDFAAAVKASGLIPLTANPRAELSPEWIELFDRVSERRAHLGLSRLARYASAQGITPGGINDEVVGGFIEDVRKGSLHRKPNELYR
jgi:hypothetical protein